MGAVDCTLKGVPEQYQAFGWYCGALGRGLQAVVEKGSREDIAYACIQHSYLWQHSI